MLGFFPSAALPFVPIESHTNDGLAKWRSPA